MSLFSIVLSRFSRVISLVAMAATYPLGFTRHVLLAPVGLGGEAFGGARRLLPYALRMDKPDARPFLPNISQPAQRALREAGYTELEQLSNVSDSELLQLHGFGPEALMLVKEALQEAGLRTAADPQGAPSSPEDPDAKSGEATEKDNL